MKTLLLRRALPFLTVGLVSLASSAFAQNRSQLPAFNKQTDFLLLQHDFKPDPDDVHAVAVFGAFRRHPDFAGVKYFGVIGAYDTTRSFDEAAFVERAAELGTPCFGVEGTDWVDADAAFNRSNFTWSNTLINKIRDEVKPTLDAGGRVWLAEAGHSNLTRKWVQALLDAGVSSSTLSSRLILVQHGKANERNTGDTDINWLKDRVNYRKIDDGNADNQTPNYKSSDKTYVTEAMAASNPNSAVRTIWLLADDIARPVGRGLITKGGVDFSDEVEVWWIMDLGIKADTIRHVWDRYVVNAPAVGANDLDTNIDAALFDAESNPGDDTNVKIGGNNIINLNNGNWVTFNDFEFDGGISGLQIRASSATQGGRVEVRRNGPTGAIIATVDVPNTGSWLKFRNIFGTIQINQTGTQTICLRFVDTNGSGGNLMRLDWFRFFSN